MPELLKTNVWWCRFLSSSCQFFGTFEYFSLFYLVKSQKCHFRDEKLNKNLFFAGISLTLFTTISWTLLMIFTMNKLCWQIDTEQPQHWMNDSIRILFFITAIYYFISLLWDRNHERKIYEANDVKM